MGASKFNKKIWGFVAGLAVMTSATLAFAYRPYPVRLFDPRVNTVLESRFDTNKNGWIGPRERLTLSKARVNHRWEHHCDFNHNGWVDTSRERACL